MKGVQTRWIATSSCCAFWGRWASGILLELCAHRNTIRNPQKLSRARNLKKKKKLRRTQYTSPQFKRNGGYYTAQASHSLLTKILGWISKRWASVYFFANFRYVYHSVCRNKRERERHRRLSPLSTTNDSLNFSLLENACHLQRGEPLRSKWRHNSEKQDKSKTAP